MLRRQTRAFTLIELLVVISIIALLIGILLPVLGTARKQAMNVACQSNQKQVATLMLTYAQSYKDAMAYGNYSNADFRLGNRFYQAPASSTTLNPATFMASGIMYNAGIIKEGKVFFDPITPTKTTTERFQYKVASNPWPPGTLTPGATTASVQINYATRTTVYWSNSSTTTTPKQPMDPDNTGRVMWVRLRDNPTQTLLMDDLEADSSAEDYHAYGTGGGGFNASWADGSTRRIREDYYVNVNLGTPPTPTKVRMQSGQRGSSSSTGLYAFSTTPTGGSAAWDWAQYKTMHPTWHALDAAYGTGR